MDNHHRAPARKWVTHRAVSLALMAGLLVGAPAMAQPANVAIRSIPAPAEAARGLPLYPGVAPGSENATQKERWNEIMGQHAVRNVTRPTLTPYLPDPAKATGTAVIIAPGGAYMMLSMDNEGELVARRLAAEGVAAFVLKYRLDETPADDQQTLQVLGARFGAAARAGADHVAPINQPLAVDDAQVALRLVRARAAQWGVDPKRVGLLGFSAGAMTMLQATLRDAPDARPDFLGHIYGPMNTVAPPANPPPLFAALASDDPLFGDTDYGLVQAWRKARGPLEMHVFEKGDHGFGMTKKGTTSDLWIEEFVAWMRARGLLTKTAS